LLARGERLNARGWVEADAEGRWIEGAPDHRRMAAWNGTLRLPAIGTGGEIVWRSEAGVALALGWVDPLTRWVGWWMTPVPEDGEALAQRLMPTLLTTYSRASGERRGEARGVDGAVGALTLREEEVSRWIAEGKTDMEIGQILGISERTVGKHRDNIFAKVGVTNRASLTRWLLGRTGRWE
jgi:DNA-binding CsgD family transcriptional regulator